LYQTTNNYAPDKFGQQFKFTDLHHIDPVQNGPQQNPIFKQGGLNGLPQGGQGNLPINPININKGTLPGNQVGNLPGNGNGNGNVNTDIINEGPPGIDLAHGTNGVKINPVTNGGTNVTTLPNGNTGIVNKIDPVVTNHLPTNGNTGIVNKIDPVVTNHLPTNGNTGIIKPVTGNGQVINNGTVNNKLITNGPVNNSVLNNGPVNNGPANNTFHPTNLSNGNGPAFQARAQLVQPQARTFGGNSGGNNMMHSFH